MIKVVKQINYCYKSDQSFSILPAGKERSNHCVCIRKIFNSNIMENFLIRRIVLEQIAQ